MSGVNLRLHHRWLQEFNRQTLLQNPLLLSLQQQEWLAEMQGRHKYTFCVIIKFLSFKLLKSYWINILFCYCRIQQELIQSHVDKMLGLGRPASQLSSSSYLDSFSQSTSGNNQLLRPLSVTPSILEPPESPWPLQSSTPSPAWSGSIANQICTEEMSQQLPNISSSVHFSTTTRSAASIIPTVSTNTSLSSRALNNRPIGADVLLSSSSSVASEIQEQMSQSQRQKNLLEPNLGVPIREDNVRTS